MLEGTDVNITEGTGGQAEPKPRPYPLGEEIANSVTHGLGAAFGVAALSILVSEAVRRGHAPELSSALVFGATLVLLYLASTFYHAFPQPRVKHVFKVIDHSMIYLLIAGSYTPFTLVTLRDSGGPRLFAVVWGLAAAGVSLEAFWVYRPRWVSVLVYLAMGWLVLVTAKPLASFLDPGGVALLLAGGSCYTLGTGFYVLRRVPYAHMVWHLFVLAGSVCHFLAVALYVL